MPSHVEMTRRCNIETISRSAFESYEGSSSAALYVAKTENSKVNRRSKTFDNTSATANGSTASFEQLKDTTLTTSIRSFDLCDYFTLAILHLFNNVLYFGPIFTLVIIVEQADINPWLSTICLAVIVCAFLVDSFSKVHVARVTAVRNKSYQQSLIRTVMKCSLSHLLTTSISDLVDLFTDRISARFALINSCIQQAWIVVFSSTLLVIANFWTAPIVLVLLLMTIGLITYLKTSMQHLYNHEHHSKRRMFTILTNHLSGRAAIQSFDYVSNFVQE